MFGAYRFTQTGSARVCRCCAQQDMDRRGAPLSAPARETCDPGFLHDQVFLQRSSSALLIANTCVS